ncbi:MAG: hypothetical protein ABR584_08185 [Candidatus Baltobacteraceae bacterium]
MYGSEDPSTAAGASYAIEHWAAALEESMRSIRMMSWRKRSRRRGFDQAAFLAGAGPYSSR